MKKETRKKGKHNKRGKRKFFGQIIDINMNINCWRGEKGMNEMHNIYIPVFT